MFSSKFSVKPGERVRLTDSWARETLGMTDKADADARRDAHVREMAELQQRLWAEDRRAVLIVLQGMDTSGKDGTIRRVLSGLNPQGCQVTSFKRPTEEELDHDYLWRVHRVCPRRGQIGVFNRSHYEDVLVVRVHKLITPGECERRYDEINRFEKHLSDNGTRVIKFFLHISREEQRERLLERINDPLKGWKMEPADLRERRLWDQYQRAYEEALRRCSTREAPWYIIPSDRKWFRNYAISKIMVEVLRSMDLRIPKRRFDPSKIRVPR